MPPSPTHLLTDEIKTLISSAKMLAGALQPSPTDPLQKHTQRRPASPGASWSSFVSSFQEWFCGCVLANGMGKTCLAAPRGSCFPEIAGDVPGQKKRERAEPLRKTSVALGQEKSKRKFSRASFLSSCYSTWYVRFSWHHFLEIQCGKASSHQMAEDW